MVSIHEGLQSVLFVPTDVFARIHKWAPVFKISVCKDFQWVLFAPTFPLGDEPTSHEEK